MMIVHRRYKFANLLREMRKMKTLLKHDLIDIGSDGQQNDEPSDTDVHAHAD